MVEIIEVNKALVVPIVAAACVFAASTGAKEDKSGFYLTGKAGASVVSLSDQRFPLGNEEKTSEYKGGDDHDTAFGGGIAAGYDFYLQFSIPVRVGLESHVHGEADSEYSVGKDSRSGGYWRDDLKNEVSVDTLILNAYYDSWNDSAFTPWVLAGIGRVRVYQRTAGISTWDYEYGSSGRESLSHSDSTDDFAWSLGADVRYDVTPDIALDPSCHYLDADNSSMSYKDEWGDKCKPEVDVKSHDVMLGMTYNF